MAQPSMFSGVHWSVGDLTRHVRERLDSDEYLQDVWVEGEISNFSRPASGHLYFTLKDASAALRCVMWKSDAGRLRLPVQDGMSVEVHGRISVYEAGGQYQLYADQIQPVGEGALYQEFLRLKAKLEAEGLFDPARKRPIPEFPRVIGVVTSATGAAWRDILNTIQRRMPLARVILAASPVQGIEASGRLVAALTALNRQRPDIILLARGGGSIEDLWAFNDEQVVRAVAASVTPLICGVGHETDFTLCDFAADLRAPTPTAGAELATQTTREELAGYLKDTQKRLSTFMLDLIQEAKSSVASVSAQLRLLSPGFRIRSDRQRLDELVHRGVTAFVQSLRIYTVQFHGMVERLNALGPEAVLARGYAILTRIDDGRVIARMKQTSREMHVRISDGEFDVRKV